MQLTDDEIETVAKACEACQLPTRQITKLADRWLPNAKELTKLEQTAETPHRAVARVLLEKLNQKDLAIDYLRKLFRKIDWAEDFRAVVGPVIADARARLPAKQAFLYSRDNLLDEEEIRRIIEGTGPKICCLIADYNGGRKFGTGFLIGPDRIVTAMHVFEDLIRRTSKAEVPKRFRAIFDFDTGELPKGEPVDGVNSLRVVRFHQHPEDWLIVESPSFAFEGRLADYDDEQIALAKNSLDFAVVRLAEPIGEQRIPHQGAHARGWFEIGELTDANYDQDIRIAVWQHPFGFRRHFDLGRIDRTLPCDSRVMYTEASTADGASGGPCLSLNAGVIGVHVAEYRPNLEAEGNQAIRFDCIKDTIAPYLGNKPLPKWERPWKVDHPDGLLVPIVGRRILLDWLMFAIDKAPDQLMRRDRIYVARSLHGEGASGISFTAEIVTSTLAGEEDHLVIALGGARLMPREPEELVSMLGSELDIPEDVLARHPARPSVDLPAGADDGDKLDRWSSHIMPEWFLAEARKRHDAGEWTRVWILLDGLDDQPMSTSVSNFISGLIGADIDDSAVRGIARHFHWLLLGQLPPFLLREQVTLELLDNMAGLEDDIHATLKAACDEHGIAADDLPERAARLAAMAEILAQQIDGPVMPVLQMVVAKDLELLFEGLRVTP